MTRRACLSLVAACVVASAVLLPADADAQVRRGRRVAARATVVVGTPFYYRPFYYDPWYPTYWYPSPYYYGSRYYDGTSSLRLQVTPREAEVFIDGYYAGVVDDFDGTFQRLHLEPGEHDVQLYLPGYRAVTQRIYLQPRNTFQVRLSMEPLGPGEPEPLRPAGAASPPNPSAGPQTPPSTRTAPSRREAPAGPARRGEPSTGAQRNTDYGTLAIRVQPDDAEVSIDGERWDGTSSDNRLLVQLAPGPHRIEVRKDGYRTFSTEVDIRPRETAPLNVSLAR